MCRPLVVPLVASIAAMLCAQAALRANELVRFESHVRPILKAHCFRCHGEEQAKEANLDLRLVRWMLQGGDSGSAIVPGSPDESLFFQRIAAGEMPPVDKKLTDDERATIRAWIEQGAQTVRPEPEALAGGDEWTDEERAFWSFQPVRRPAVPIVGRKDLVRTPIDSFLLAELERQGLSFSRQADRRTLIRRLSFDLVGLPPSAERVERFVADPSPDAYERLVDELLASPAYGERWARHWLDVAGYADSDGYTEKDAERPWSYRYRDYVVRSFNDDKPLDRFIVEQLAGDELLSPPYENLSPDDAQTLIATGYLRMAPDGTGDREADANAAKNDCVAETIKIVSTSLLGLTVGCAQCHNHRYDAISQLDYYRFRAIFEPALDGNNWRRPKDRLVSLWDATRREAAAAVDEELKQIEGRRVAELDAIVNEIFDKEAAKLEESQRELARQARAASAEQRTAEQQQLLKDFPSLNVDRGSAYLYEPERLETFKKQYETLEAETKAKRPADDMVACLTEVPGQLPVTRLFYRGDFNQPRDEVQPAGLSVLGDGSVGLSPRHAIPVDDAAIPTSGRRLALARHLTSGAHPLVGRVLVNRVWMHHFGRGLVATPADFGALGERPSHPELLDWLADELVRGEWRLKAMHRLIVTSTVYRQSSLAPRELHEMDPDNRLLGRMPVRRLETEAIRDAMLACSGDRDERMYGPAIPVVSDDVGQVVLGKGERDGNGIVQNESELGGDLYRRSLYVQVRRSLPLSMLEPFDPAGTAPNCELRTSSTVAPQSLLMMNNGFVVSQAERFAKRVAAEAGDEPAAQVRRAWEIAYGRQATDAELLATVEFLSAQQRHFESLAAGQETPPELTPAVEALASLCQALFCSNRFLYVD